MLLDSFLGFFAFHFLRVCWRLLNFRRGVVGVVIRSACAARKAAHAS